jgi:integrase
VDRTDFLRRTIRIDRQLITLVGQAPYLGPVKTISSVRAVPVPQVVLDVLAHQIATYPPGPFGVIFTHPNGQPIHRSHLGHVWRRAAKSVGLTGVTFHALRHYAASALIASGASVKSVQHFLGHASAKVTLDTYAHLWPDDEDRTRAALEAALAPVAAGAQPPAAAALS